MMLALRAQRASSASPSVPFPSSPRNNIHSILPIIVCICICAGRRLDSNIDFNPMYVICRQEGVERKKVAGVLPATSSCAWSGRLDSNQRPHGPEIVPALKDRLYRSGRQVTFRYLTCSFVSIDRFRRVLSLPSLDGRLWPVCGQSRPRFVATPKRPSRWKDAAYEAHEVLEPPP